MTDTNTNGTPSAGIRRYALLANLDPEGEVVRYTDHLAAIAAAEQRGWERAREAAAHAVCEFCREGKKPRVDRDSPSHLVHLFSGYPPRDCKAAAILALAFTPASGSEAKEERTVLGFPVVTDSKVPRGEIHFVDQETWHEVGRITGIGQAKEEQP